MNIGDKVILTQSIFDDGEDHHPPGFCGYSGETVLIKNIYDDNKLSVHHEEVTDGSAFIIYDNEWKLPPNKEDE